MTMAYILTGDPREVEKVIQENRIRVERGVIKFTPAQPETVVEPSRIEPLDADNPSDTVTTPANMADDKNIEVEDLTEAGIDDVKDCVVVDAKAVPAVTPKKKRTT